MSEFKCSNCNARIHESTFRDRNGMCGLCASNPEIAEKRRSVAVTQKAKGIANPRCAACGISEADRIRELEEAERRRAFIYMKDWPCLLYCENCDKYFCGGCQVDLGMNSGCPECRGALDK